MSEQKVFAAADEAKSLSELLKKKKLLGRDGLRWLDDRQIDKFYKAINKTESSEVFRIAQSWPSSRDSKYGFTLLDWLWLIGPKNNYERDSLSISSSQGYGSGRTLVARLALFQPEWVAKWWRWRCETDRGHIYPEHRVERILVNTISGDKFQTHCTELQNEVVGKIIGLRPELIDCLPRKRWGHFLQTALDAQLQTRQVVQSLIKHGISPPSTVVDYIFESDQAEMGLLDTLVNEWRSLTELDPVTVAIGRGHSRLEELLQSQWGVASRSRSEENFWMHPLQHGGASPALLAGLGALPNHFIPELGFSIGLSIAEESQEPSVELIQEYLNDFNVKVHGIADALLPIVELWASLRAFAIYLETAWEHSTELVGLRAKIASIASNNPRLWAQSLRWILARSRAFDHLAEDVTLALATIASEVRQALETACSDENESIRFKSRGLWTLLNGLEGSDLEFGRTLADAAARYVDGSPLFPHPLDPLSATWLGSLGVEQAIKDGIHRATSRFAAEVPDQGGDIEEALTKSLIKEIEVEFRQIRPRLELIGSKSRSVAPALLVQQRPISKSVEEPVYGCDLAWIVNAAVDGRLQGTWVELIQVKKSMLLQKHGAKLRTDSWRIESKQLTDILKWSSSAVYWLIASAGEVLVIPAKYFLAIKNARAMKAPVEKFTVGYHEARTVAVPLHQYLVDLLIGQWVGTSSEDVVRFARGENSTIRPRAVIEVTITISLSKEKQ